MEIPDALAQRIEHFRTKGRVFAEAMELFSTPSWVSVMLGQGIVPEQYEPAVDGLDEEKVAQALEQMRQAILDTAERLPRHGEFIAQCCASPASAAPSTEFAF
jgi:tryptophan halogenase